MGRLHGKGKGISSSAIPYSRQPPAWLKTTPEQVVDQVCKLARKGATPSQIGVILRDSHGIAQVKVVTGMFSISLIDVTCMWSVANASDYRQQDPTDSQVERYGMRFIVDACGRMNGWERVNW